MASDTFRRSDSFIGAELEDGVMLLNVEAGRYHSLDPVASRIWEMLAEPTDEDSLVSRLLGEFDVTPEQCRRDVKAFLAQLRARGMLAAG